MWSHSTGSMIPRCPVCNSSEWKHDFGTTKFHVWGCDGCGAVCKLPIGTERCVTSAPINNREAPATDARTISTLVDQCLESLDTKVATNGRLLIVAPEEHPIADAARSRGYRVTISPTALDSTCLQEVLFDGCVVTSFEQADDPRHLLEVLARQLAPGAPIFLITWLTDTWIARHLGANWFEWNSPGTYYLNRSQLHGMLLAAGFHNVWFRKGQQRPTIGYTLRQLALVNSAALKMISSIGIALLPSAAQRSRFPFKLPTGKVLITARVAPADDTPMLSIIMPVFNERETFLKIISALIDKRLSGVTREIIIVESNSSDGTRELVRAYEGHPDIRIIYQERPMGKGHAVRDGLDNARGRVVLIQDADLEYDLDDYEALLKPLLGNKHMFVLGSRHRGDWKIRRFRANPMKALVLNSAHFIICSLINFLYRQEMTDPFTMYKVFYRDCAYGLTFECNLFDFDHELLIKLIRKGYRPHEVPVNYTARTFAEGKKIRFLRDGLTGVWADIKYRFAPISSKK